MGITGLLPFLDKASERINIRTLANKSVAIDSYCWLHKGAFAVGDKLVRGEETDVHIMYCLKYVNMLLSYNIKPILVFDGRHLPAKAETEAKRRESRKNAKQRAIELMRKGNHHEARNYLRRCVDITHEMALQLIQSCRSINVDCIVAPYEADAQLAYLNKIGLADYVITEDSDLTLFGCRKILFKLDLAGECTLVDADKLHLAMDCRLDKFSMDKFRLMCILSGCDYIDSLPGIGLVKACKFVMKTEETDMMRALDKIPAYLNMRHLIVTEEYKINVLKAAATFLHMVVYDPRVRKQVRLHDIDEFGTDIEYCSNAGELLDDEIALNLAVGNLNPFSLKKLDSWHPDNRNKKVNTTINMKGLRTAKHPSIWQRDYRFNVSVASKATKEKNNTCKKLNTQTTKRSMEAAVPSIEEDDPVVDSQNEENLLNEYAQIDKPSSKRFKEDIEDSSDEDTNTEIHSPSKTTTPIRNPFKKPDKPTEDLLSPTEITKENNSLVKNQSPVKRIDFRKLEKLSRFNRTVVTNNQPVLSKFFNAPAKSSEVDIPEENIEIETDMNSEDTEAKNDMAVCVRYSESGDSAISMNGDHYRNEFPNKEENIESNNVNDQASILEKFRYNYSRMVQEEGETDSGNGLTNSQQSSDKTDSDVSEQPITISDESNDYEEGMNTDPVDATSYDGRIKSSQNTSKPACRKVGLKRKAPSTKSKAVTLTSTSSSVQSKLSMFGFQKKPQVQP